jgi:hypothetical protein
VSENLYVHKVTGTLMRVDAVDESFAWISVLAPTQSRYAMPIADYDGEKFAATWRLASGQESLDALAGGDVRPPLRSLVGPPEAGGPEAEPTPEEAAKGRHGPRPAKPLDL